MIPTVSVGSILNLRDVGGLRTWDGRTVRPGLIYRSATPFFLLPDDARFLINTLNIRTRIDLRSSLEVAEGTNKHLPMIEKHVAHLPFRSGGVWKEDALVTDQAERVASHYLRYLEHSPESIIDVVTLLATPARLPALIHCTVGKDRTGVAVALVLSAVGVFDSEIIADYARTRDQLELLMKQLRSVPTYADRIAELPAESLSAEPQSMSLFLQRVQENYGDARTYLIEHELPSSTLDKLAETLLDIPIGGSSSELVDTAPLPRSRPQTGTHRASRHS